MILIILLRARFHLSLLASIFPFFGEVPYEEYQSERDSFRSWIFGTLSDQFQRGSPSKKSLTNPFLPLLP